MNKTRKFANEVLELIENDLFEMAREKIRAVIEDIYNKLDELEQRIELLEEAIETVNKRKPDTERIPALREVL